MVLIHSDAETVCKSKVQEQKEARAAHLLGVMVLEVIVLRSPHTFKVPKIPAQVSLQKYDAMGPRCLKCTHSYQLLHFLEASRNAASRTPL